MFVSFLLRFKILNEFPHGFSVFFCGLCSPVVSVFLLWVTFFLLIVQLSNLVKKKQSLDAIRIS
jgi:hypothetical protein